MNEQLQQFYEALFHLTRTPQQRAETILGESLSHFADSPEAIKRLYEAGSLEEIMQLLREIRTDAGHIQTLKDQIVELKEFKKGLKTVSKNYNLQLEENRKLKTESILVRQRYKRFEDAMIAWRQKYFELYTMMNGLEAGTQLILKTQADERKSNEENS